MYINVIYANQRLWRLCDTNGETKLTWVCGTCLQPTRAGRCTEIEQERLC